MRECRERVWGMCNVVVDVVVECLLRTLYGFTGCVRAEHAYSKPVGMNITRRPPQARTARPDGGIFIPTRLRLFGDQLWPADAGSWQIADGSDPRTTRAQVTSVAICEFTTPR